VLGIHDGVDGEVSFAGSGEDFLGLRGVGRGGAFDGLEAGVAGDLEALEDGEFLGEHGELDGFADGESRGGCGGYTEEGRGGEDLAARGVRHGDNCISVKMGLRMELQEIVRRMERWRGRFEREAVEAAVERREEITPELLRMLEETVNRAEELAPSTDWMGHLYAMCLLAQFREVRAYPLVVRFGRLPGDLLDGLCGDFLTEDLNSVLASVCGGQVAGIESLIEDEAAFEWVRGAALESLVTLVAQGLKSREEVVAYFGRLFSGGLAREGSRVWTALVCCSCDLYPDELREEIERAFADGLVDTGDIDVEHVHQDLKQGKDRIMARTARDRHRRLIDDAAEHIEKWCPAEVRPAASVAWSPTPVISPVRSTPKVGRNDPCPCGSGKKYKKCCGG
jgi:hypothetical protein